MNKDVTTFLLKLLGDTRQLNSIDEAQACAAFMASKFTSQLLSSLPDIPERLFTLESRK